LGVVRQVYNYPSLCTFWRQKRAFYTLPQGVRNRTHASTVSGVAADGVSSAPRILYPPIRAGCVGNVRLSLMPLILILVILLLVFGGGGYYMGPGVGYYGGGGLSLVLLIVILFLLFGRGRGRL